MSLTRRSLLHGALLTAATAALGSRGVRASPSGALLVYDSRLPQGRALRNRHDGPAVDLQREHANSWRTLRCAARHERVVGLTRWSDLVQARSLLQERGLRMRLERRQGQLFYWEMA